MDEFVEADVRRLDGDICPYAYGRSGPEGSGYKFCRFRSALLGADEVGGIRQAGD